jgi:hypothetical protein
MPLISAICVAHSHFMRHRCGGLTPPAMGLVGTHILVWCATHKEGPAAHITECTTATYPWSTETGCAVDNGPMDKGFPSSGTTARARATTPHDTSSHNPSCTGQTACRPRPLHQRPGPPPRPKSQNAFTETLDRADSLATLRHKTVTQTMQASAILWYSLRPIILFVNVDVSRHILVVDTSVLAKSNMDRRE